MITRVRLKNFLSYEDETVELGGSTIAVTGENGAGKSSLLEAIPYALFGLGRDTMGNMSRINGDGSHEVIVWIGDVEVKRGRKGSGTGYCEVRIDGDLKAKGKEATEWIQQYLGMDADTFMLTAFFGLHDVRHDPLIRVLPSARLETLQKLSEVGPYRLFHKRAKEEYARAAKAVDQAMARKDGAESAMGDPDEIKSLMVEEEKALHDAEEQYRLSKERKSKLLVEEEKYQAFLREKSELGIERKTLDRDIRQVEHERQEAERSLESAKTTSEESRSAKKKIKLPAIKPEDYREEIERMTAQIGEAAGRLDLLRQAGTFEGNTCPLCLSHVSDEQLSAWETEREELEARISQLQADSGTKRSAMRRFNDLRNELDALGDSIASAVGAGEKAQKAITDCDRELSRLRSEKEKKDGRYIDLQERLGDDYQRLHRDIEAVNEQLDGSSGDMRAAKRGIRAYKDQLEAIKQTRKEIAEYGKVIKSNSVRMQAAELLVSAWSRYGIPMRLMRETMQTIANVSTEVYKEFDDGRITVQEVEDRGKPGVEFFLEDRKGQRTFAQLSAGEKVMFFVAVRVAVAEIVARSGARAADFLILDEAMGNLSPKRRDDLIRLINKVLRNRYPQVVMVSHTEMRDIFTETLRVSAENGISRIEVAV